MQLKDYDVLQTFTHRRFQNTSVLKNSTHVKTSVPSILEHELSQDPFSNVKDDFTEAAGFIPATELGAREVGV